MSQRPRIVAHADWGKDRTKRWIAVARLENGRYEARDPQPVSDSSQLVDRLLEEADGEGLLVGFDFPIGLPERYAELAEINGFLPFLSELSKGEWSDFFRVAERPEEISVGRPFYPYRPGDTKQEYLLKGLRVSSLDELLRRCERAQPWRKAACPLFWTMGAQQVGKGAISGWKEVILPEIQRSRSKIWPFHGSLADLTSQEAAVICETYPADAYSYIGVNFRNPNSGKTESKAAQTARARQSRGFTAWAEDRRVGISEALREEVEAGFGSLPNGEDRFDAIAGLFGMLEVTLGRRAPGNPVSHQVNKIEGWILGQGQT